MRLMSRILALTVRMCTRKAFRTPHRPKINTISRTLRCRAPGLLYVCCARVVNVHAMLCYNMIQSTARVCGKVGTYEQRWRRHRQRRRQRRRSIAAAAAAAVRAADERERRAYPATAFWHNTTKNTDERTPPTIRNLHSPNHPRPHAAPTPLRSTGSSTAHGNVRPQPPLIVD